MKLTSFVIIVVILALFKNELRFSLPYKTIDFIEVKHEFGRSFNSILGPSRFYTGTEIQLEKNAEIYSMYTGTVLSTCDTCTKNYGKEVSIKHNDSIVVKYYFLNSVMIELGDKVKKGQLIGIAGSTGLTTVNGLGISFSINNRKVNPEEYINLNTKSK